MDVRFRQLCREDLLACAAVGGPSVRGRVEHELDRRAADALIRRILARRPPARHEAVQHRSGAPVAA
jgi:hypothetical protein